jgi:hypothetical protein
VILYEEKRINNLGNKFSLIYSMSVVFPGNGARNACGYLLTSIGVFRKRTELSRSTSLGEYRVFIPQEDGRLESIQDYDLLKVGAKLILGRWTIV